jgi:membrane protease YdiL (CAAX protease family)
MRPSAFVLRIGFMQEILPLRRRLVWLGGLLEGSLGLVAGLLGWFFDQPWWDRIHWEMEAAVWGIGTCVPMLCGFVGCMYSRLGPLARIKQFSQEIVGPLFASCTVLDLAALSLLAGFGEETLFRGFLQSAFAEWVHPWGGLVLASLLFGLLHPITPTYFLLASLIGAYLGSVWLISENLLVVILAHALYDFVVLVVLVRGASRNQPSTHFDVTRSDP